MNSSITDKLVTLASETKNISALWLYGSRAKGNHRPDSDYDLAVLFTDWVEDPLDRRLRPELLAMNWSKKLGLTEDKLSIVDIQNAPIPLAMNTISGKLLYCGDDDARLSAEGIIMSKAELDYQYHLKHFGF
ncbi:nucleotidyltransferase domain-containing protein [Marinomonas piezotolerans]|uniref:Nucleotidyltransferase domain-containing protein n=1 Tax=Marinomonas piezotolerans TaxID=2213058 RepID=A0A370UBT3_9GAMM|nr:nucleotidyltransferase domain-containing protein [Marinomonas piezotolerans]RDL45155.1 nucleotidyltransferase domain-containing protein [Marinomonas piezotolerans]